MSRYDAIIVGSGPAALAAALTLAERRAEVMLLSTDIAPCGGSLVQSCFELEPGFAHWTLPALGYREQPCWAQLLPDEPLQNAYLQGLAGSQQLSALLDGANAQAVAAFRSLAEQSLEWLDGWYAQGAAADREAVPVLPPELLPYADCSLEEVSTALALPPEVLLRLQALTPLLGIDEASFGTWSARLLQYLQTGLSRPQAGWYGWCLHLLERFEQLGGVVRLGCPLKGILWRNDRIAGLSTPRGDDRSPALIWTESDERPLWQLLREASPATAQLFRPQIALQEARGVWQRQTLRLGLLPGAPQLPSVRVWPWNDGLLQAHSLPVAAGTLLTLSALGPQADKAALLAEYTALSGFDPRPYIKELAADSRPWPRGGSSALPGDDALARALTLPQEAAVRGLYLAGPAQALTDDPDGLVAGGCLAARKVKS